MTFPRSLYPHLSPAHLADAEAQFRAMRVALDEMVSQYFGGSDR